MSFRAIPRGLGATPVCADISKCAGLYSGPDPGPGENSWMVSIGNRLAAANAAYQATVAGGVSSGQNLTLEQSFAAAGLTDAEIACWLAHEASWVPEVVDYNMATGCGAPPVTAPGASPYGTNYAAVAPALAASNAQIAATAASAAPASAVVTSTAGASPLATSAPVSGGASCFALFGDSSCIGPIGTTTALVLGAAAVALFLMFGGKR
jgi:hypothetical protein